MTCNCWLQPDHLGCLLLADSVEKVASAAASRSGVPDVEVAESHFELPFGVSLSVLAQA